MNKWEKGFYRNGFYEMREKLEENFRQQQEMLERITAMTVEIDKRLNKTENLLREIKEDMKGVEKTTEYKIYEVYTQLCEMINLEIDNTKEGFQEVSSLMKMLLVNAILDDMNISLGEEKSYVRNKNNEENPYNRRKF